MIRGVLLMAKSVLLRHGQSIWYLENKSTGWMDITLSDQNIGEAHQAGKLLKGEGYSFDSFDSLVRSFESYVSLNTLNVMRKKLQLF